MKKYTLFLLLLILPFLLFSAESVGVSHDAGTYGKNITLKLSETDDEGDEIYYYFEESYDHTPVAYTVPLTLSALPGEERIYTLVLTGKDGKEEKDRMVYRIDRKIPPSPEVSVSPGVYYDEIALTFSYSQGESLYYSVITADYAEFKKWDGSPVLLRGKDGYIVTYTVKVYALDGAGNRSYTEEYTYIINKNTSDKKPFLDVLSPAAGTFLNRQLLACSHRGFSWIRYTFDGTNPVTEGLEYTKPVLINKTGQITLRIAGYSENSKNIIEKKVKLTVSGEAIPVVSRESGVITESTEIRYIGPEGFAFTLDDTTPGIYDERDFKPITLEPVENLQYPTVLRFKNPDRLNGEYRYTYIIDGRKPLPPKIVSFFPKEGPGPKIAIVAEKDTSIYYSLNGSKQSVTNAAYEDVFSIEPRQTSGPSEVTVRAYAVSHNGISSDIAEEEVRFHYQELRTPTITKTDNTTLTIEVPSEGGIVYEKGYSPLTLKVPDAESPRIGGEILYQLPYGMEKKDYFQFASVDDYGNVSAPSDIFELYADYQPPAKPEIRHLDGIIKILSEDNSTVYYTLEKIIDGEEGANKEQQAYDGPFFVYGTEGKKVEYRIFAYAVDTRGNKSALAGPTQFTVDKRSISEPLVTGVEEGKSYNKPVTVRFTSEYTDQRVLYSLTIDDDEAAEEEAAGPVLTRESLIADDGVIAIPGEENKAVNYTLVYAPYLEGRDIIGQEKKINFIIDREFPELPVITGFEHERRYNQGIVLELQNPVEGDTVYYGIGTDGTAPPDCFGEKGRKFDSPMTIEGEANEEITYSLLFGAMDEAGNKTYHETFHMFTIDKKPPDVPKPEVLHVSEKNGNAEVRFPAASDTLFYEISEDNTLPSIPTRESPRYDPENPIVLPGIDGKEKMYHLQVAAVDSSGNHSSEAPIFSITVDKERPFGEHKPVIVSYKSGTFELRWDPAEDMEIFYSLPGKGWEKYSEPIIISSPSGEELEYYVKDQFGNRSETFTTELPKYKKIIEKENFLTGAENGKRYGNKVTIGSEEKNYVCRYEVSYRKEYLRGISQFSPAMGGDLLFDVLPGETRDFYISSRLFDPETNLPVSDQISLHFTIDKTKPEVPVFEFEESRHFQDRIAVPIGHEEGDVYYTVSKYDILGNLEENIEETLYNQPVVLDVKDGEFARFALSAYTVDEVGNKSPVVSLEDLIVDKKIVYLSRLGNDLYSGSRTKPFKTIQKAVEYAYRTNRNIIYISGGNYQIDDPIILGEDITIYGGYDPFTWEDDTNSETVVTGGEYLRRGEPMISIQDGSAYVKSVSFVTANNDPVPVKVESGNLRLKNVIIMNVEDDTNPVLFQTGGGVEITDSKIQSFSSRCNRIISNRGGTLKISKSVIENRGTNRGVISLLHVKGGESIEIDNTSFNGGNAQESTCLDVADSFVDISNSILHMGSNNERSYGIRFDESNVNLEKVDVLSDESTRINTTCTAVSSKIRITASEFIITGKTGGIGFATEQSEIEIRKSVIIGKGAGEFIYTMQCGNSDTFLSNNYLVITTDADYIGVDADGGDARIINNTFIFSSDSSNSFALWCKNTAKNYIVNNIIVQRDGSPDATAIMLEKADDVRIIANNIFGWQHALIDDTGKNADSRQINAADGNPRGGEYHKNISETFTNAFLISKKDIPYTLKQTSRCVNGGVTTCEYGGTDEDYAGDPRPNPNEGLKPEYDIGADEF